MQDRQPRAVGLPCGRMEDDREFVFRPLGAEDAAAAAQVIQSAFASQSVATDPPPSALTETAASVAATLVAPDQGGIGAWAGAALAGCVLWEVQPRGLYLGRLSVAPAFRRRGLAPALVAAMEAEARRRSLPRLLLSTRLILADNRRLFARCGFVETAQHAHPGYAHPTFVDMEKAL
jgi:predicted N-acetyltransferase YhbS